MGGSVKFTFYILPEGRNEVRLNCQGSLQTMCVVESYKIRSVYGSDGNRLKISLKEVNLGKLSYYFEQC